MCVYVWCIYWKRISSVVATFKHNCVRNFFFESTRHCDTSDIFGSPIYRDSIRDGLTFKYVKKNVMAKNVVCWSFSELTGIAAAVCTITRWASATDREKLGCNSATILFTCKRGKWAGPLYPSKTLHVCCVCLVRLLLLMLKEARTATVEHIRVFYWKKKKKHAVINFSPASSFRI